MIKTFNQSQCLTLYIDFSTQKKIAEKMRQSWKTIVQLNGQHYMC